MSAFADYREHVGVDLDRFFKTTLFQTERLLLGLDCLEPGQAQVAHRHAGRDKFYYVIAGQGDFTIGDEQRSVGVGGVVWAGADVVHGVANAGAERLIMLVGIAPEPR